MPNKLQSFTALYQPVLKFDQQSGQLTSHKSLAGQPPVWPP